MFETLAYTQLASEDCMARQRKRIGPYQLIEEVGSGGMGVVWRAVHTVLQREVAIKELVGNNAQDKEALERFRREGMALAQLRHESVVGIHDLFPSSTRLYMVLEYVDGPTLASLLKEAPLPWDVVATIGARVAAALEHAHHHKLIHRDVKPANVMLSKPGEVKLTDFGIARDQVLGDLTKTGYAVGTPSYMPPEVLTGERADARSDIYSLGVTLYECVTGRNPFAEHDSSKIFGAILANKFPRLGKVRRGLPRRFRAIIERCMRADARKRYATAADLRRDFERLLVDSGARANHRERIVGFLRSRGRISETEALTCLNAAELLETVSVELAAPPNRFVRAVASLAAALLGGSAGWWLAQRPELWERLLP
ncbi:MAG: serine/threonine-protein kinase [Myxococcales bacterium]|jgi:serine/threonine protein kinase